MCFGGCFVRRCLIDIKPTIDNFCSFGEPKRHYCRLYCFSCNLATSINTSHEAMNTLPRGIIINSVFHCHIQSSLRITLQTAGWKEDPRMCSLFVIMVPPWILPLFCANLMVIVVLFFWQISVCGCFWFIFRSQIIFVLFCTVKYYTKSCHCHFKLQRHSWVVG